MLPLNTAFILPTSQRNRFILGKRVFLKPKIRLLTDAFYQKKSRMSAYLCASDFIAVGSEFDFSGWCLKEDGTYSPAAASDFASAAGFSKNTGAERKSISGNLENKNLFTAFKQLTQWTCVEQCGWDAD
jgi:hypothetical protein